MLVIIYTYNTIISRKIFRLPTQATRPGDIGAGMRKGHPCVDYTEGIMPSAGQNAGFRKNGDCAGFFLCLAFRIRRSYPKS